MGCQVRRAWRQLDGFNIRLLQDIAKGLAKLGVAIHEKIACAQYEPVDRVRQIPGYLLHPVLVRIHGATCEVNPTSRHFHHKKQVERDQSTFGPDFNRREVDCSQNVPVGSKEGFPSGLTLPLSHRLDAVFFQDVSDGLIRDFMSEVGQRSLNTIVAPGRDMWSSTYLIAV